MKKRHHSCFIVHADQASRHGGFTLLEMLISLAIFTVVAVFAVGALVRITGLNRQSQTLQSSMNNLGFALETLSREVRVGSKYYCNVAPNINASGINWSNLGTAQCNATVNPATSQDLFFAFLSSRTAVDGGGKLCRLVTVYRFMPYMQGSNNQFWYLKKGIQTSCGQTLADSDFASVLDDGRMSLTGYQLGVYKSSPNYSWVFLRLTGYSGVRLQDQNPFDIQTSISERIHD